MAVSSTISRQIARIPTHLVVAGSAWGGRAIMGVASVVRIRFLIEGLGEERYAAFALLSGLIGWFTLTDFGLGAALQNCISEQRAEKRAYDAWIRTVLQRLLLFNLALGLALLLVGPWVADWYLGNTVLAADVKRSALWITSLCLLTTTAGSVGYKNWYAEHRGYLSNIFPAVGSVLSLALIWWVTQAKPLGSADFLSCAVAGFAPPALLAGLSLWGRGRRSPDAAPLKASSKQRMMLRARDFWFFALLNAGVLHVDYLVASQHLGASDVVVYNLGTRVFDTVRLFYGALLLALWPTCTELIARRAWPDVFRYLRFYVGIGMGGMAMFGALMLVVMPSIIAFLAPGQSVVVPASYILLLTGLEVVRIWSNTFAMVLNAMSKVRVFWLVLPVQLLVNAGAQLYLAPRYGFQGVSAGVLIGFLATVAWAMPLAVWRQSRAPAEPRAE